MNFAFFVSFLFDESVAPEGVKVSRIFHIQPLSSALYPTDKPQSVAITFRSEKEVEIKSLAIIKCQVREGGGRERRREEGEGRGEGEKEEGKRGGREGERKEGREGGGEGRERRREERGEREEGGKREGREGEKEERGME